MQSPFHSLAARIVLLNAILMAQLWYFMVVWVPTSKDYQTIWQMMHSFL